MNEKPSNDPGAPEDGCLFPTGPNQVCARPIAQNNKPTGGRRTLYCDNPDHTRGKAFAARRQYELATARNHTNNPDQTAQLDSAISDYPVTDGQIALGALLARFEQSSAQLATILERTRHLMHTVSDPEAAAYEVAQTKRETTMQLAQAHSNQATAEHQAKQARQHAAHQTELRAQADEAADHALHQIEQIRQELASAQDAKTHAETEKHSAQQAAEHQQAKTQILQQQLDQERQDHRHNLDTLRQEAHNERTALAKHYADQIAALLTTTHQTNNHTQPTPTTPPKHRMKKQHKN